MVSGTSTWLLLCLVAGLSHGAVMKKETNDEPPVVIDDFINEETLDIPAPFKENLNISPAMVRIVAPRSANQLRQLQVDAFNKRHEVSLHPTPSIFTDNFKLLRTARDLKGELFFEEEEEEDYFDMSNIFHDPDTGAVLHVDGNKVEGLLSYDLSIIPSTNGHEVIRHAPIHSFHSDYMKLPDNIQEDYEKKATARKVSTAYPELLIFSDFALSNVIGSSQLKKYMAIFWSSVSQSFTQMTDPKVKLLLSTIIRVTSEADQLYIQANKLEGNAIDSYKVLDSFGEMGYLKRNDLPQYDIAILQTGMDMAKDVKGNTVTTISGLAFTDGACYLDSLRTMAYKSAVVEDMHGAFLGYVSAIHELAHSLGSPHDPKEAGSTCNWDLGYIMSYPVSTKKFDFSSCSKASMKKYINTFRASCLTNTKSSSWYPTFSRLPGQLVDMDQQCKKRTGDPGSVINKEKTDNEQCIELNCTFKKSDGKAYNRATGTPAFEGSPCRRSGGTCINAQCGSYV